MSFVIGFAIGLFVGGTIGAVMVSIVAFDKSDEW
jgi:hypothetical protein